MQKTSFNIICVLHKNFGVLKIFGFFYHSVDQILTHWFSTMLLSLRYIFCETKNCIVLGEYNVEIGGVSGDA